MKKFLKSLGALNKEQLTKVLKAYKEVSKGLKEEAKECTEEMECNVSKGDKGFIIVFINVLPVTIKGGINTVGCDIQLKYHPEHKFVKEANIFQNLD